jgi:hypothetical protein
LRIRFYPLQRSGIISGGDRRSKDGGWKMADGRWRMEDGGWKVEERLVGLN